MAVAYFNIKIPELLGVFINTLTRYARVNSNSSGLDGYSFDFSEFFTDMKGPSLNLFGMYLFQSAFTFVYILLLSQIGEQMAAKLRQDLFKQIIIQDLSFFDANRTGELVNRLTADVQDFKSCFKQCVSQGLRSAAQLIGIFPGSPYQNSPLTQYSCVFDFRWWNFIVFDITEAGNGSFSFGAVCSYYYVNFGWCIARY